MATHYSTKILENIKRRLPKYKENIKETYTDTCKQGWKDANIFMKAKILMFKLPYDLVIFHDGELTYKDKNVKNMLRKMRESYVYDCQQFEKYIIPLIPPFEGLVYLNDYDSAVVNRLMRATIHLD